MGDYPTESELRFIKNFNIVKNPVSQLMEYVENIWQFHDWGFRTRKVRDEYKSVMNLNEKPKQRYHIEIELHTGGWSGNEDIIGALQDNEWFFNFYWQQSVVGGHYTFRIPFDTWNKEAKDYVRHK